MLDAQLLTLDLIRALRPLCEQIARSSATSPISCGAPRPA
jgi:hypothetical protein